VPIVRATGQRQQFYACKYDGVQRAPQKRAAYLSKVLMFVYAQGIHTCTTAVRAGYGGLLS